MTRRFDFVLTIALCSSAACGDNGTLLGSMASGGTDGNAGAGGTQAGSSGSSNGGSAGSSSPSSGGSSTAGSAGGATPSNGGTNAAGAPGSAGTSNGGSGCTVAGDCKSVVQNVAARLAEAQVCYPSTGPDPQCPAQVSDGCGCMVSVVSVDTPATQCYLEALAQLSSMSGCANCVPSPCVPPTGQCFADGSDVLRCR